MQWPKRAKVTNTSFATFRRWQVDDLAIVEIRSKLHYTWQRRKKVGDKMTVVSEKMKTLPVRFLLIRRLRSGNECVLSEHKSKRSAERAAEVMG